MPRYYRRRRRFARRRAVATKRFAVETTVVGTGLGKTPEGTIYQQGAHMMIPPTTMQGVRKVSRFTLEFSGYGNLLEATFAWALVYAPNYNASQYQAQLAPVASTPTSLFEPNQYLIMSGVYNTRTTNNFMRKSPLSRNLNSEDTILLLVRMMEPSGDSLQNGQLAHGVWTLRYAIAY